MSVSINCRQWKKEWYDEAIGAWCYMGNLEGDNHWTIGYSVESSLEGYQFADELLDERVKKLSNEKGLKEVTFKNPNGTKTTVVFLAD